MASNFHRISVSLITFAVFWIGSGPVHVVASDDNKSDSDVAKTQTADKTELPESPLKVAHTHFQKGRIDEAIAAYKEAAEKKGDPIAIAIGISDCHVFEGRIAEALVLLTETLKKQPESSIVASKLAELFFLKGNYADGLKHSEEALKLDPELPLGHLIHADCLTELGKLKAADEEYRWCLRYYNRVQPTAAETLLIVGRGSAQYARWHSVPQVFKFVVNTLSPDALKDDPESWQAYYLSGSLLLEKYNRADGLPELQSALKINGRAPDVLAALGNAAFDRLELTEAASFAERALAVNPHHVAALQLQADLALRDLDSKRALAALEKAREFNPHDQRTLARIASAYLLEDGQPPAKEVDEVLSHLDNIEQVQLTKPSRFSGILIDLARRNPHPGYGLQALADELQSRLRFELAEKCYKAAMAAMPLYAEPKTSLGLLYMRVGKSDEAKKILDQAFKSDPFHVRVDNMRKLIGVLDTYATISTEHFVVRVDGKADKLLGKYVSEYLEEIYPKLTQQFGFEPPVRTQFEIFSKAKGLTAHSLFSTRMTGLPQLHTIGASTGWIVALTSPTSGERGFNWAKVLKHEFVHIITLQQTHFNCPHWLTEALAVMSEESPRSEVWTQLLLERVPKGELMNLDNINLGFQRPKSALDWQMAYCQSHLYAKFLLEKYGPDSLKNLLNAYRDGLSTAKAIEKVCGVKQAEFELGYIAYVKQLASTLKAFEDEPEEKTAELRKKHAAEPGNLQIGGQLALTLVKLKQTKEARQVAEKIVEQDPSQPHAAATMALLMIRAEDTKGAVKYLEPALDGKNPNPTVLRLLAKLKTEQGDFVRAAELFELGAQHDPDGAEWLKGLFVAYTKTEQKEKCEAVLRRLVDLAFEDAAPRKKLAQLLLERNDFAGVVQFGRLALQIDVMDAEVHQVLGKAYAGLKQEEKAISELEAAIELNSEDQVSVLALAKLLIELKRQPEAKNVLAKFLEKTPDSEAAQELQKTLK
ncbi:MAG: tetratricopeptide repeat protein [Planctomycetaceae bacterium]|nr:tetratricopeptide repeat protein [Planctomycetaceae bacterium]